MLSPIQRRQAPVPTPPVPRYSPPAPVPVPQFQPPGPPLLRPLASEHVPVPDLTPIPVPAASPRDRNPGRPGADPGGRMGGGPVNWGGGISPGSLEGMSTFKRILYLLGLAAVLFILFAVYAAAMLDDEAATRPVPTGGSFEHVSVDGIKKPGCWNYENRMAWWWSNVPCLTNNSCGGRRQSPVNIATYSVVYDLAMTPLHFEGHHIPLDNFVITNDGLALTLRPSPSDRTRRTVRGGRLPGTFVFHYALFHWGSDSRLGSEHRIDGAVFPMEVQFVYINKKYTNTTALNRKDGLAIIAALYELTYVGLDSVLALRRVVAALEAKTLRLKERRRSLRHLLPWMLRRLVRRRSHQGDMERPLRLDHLLPAKRDRFYAYRGSLTWPPCTESVHWRLFERRSFVTEELLQQLRRLPGWTRTGKLSDNFRPPQKLNGRKIYSSFRPF